MDCKTAISVPLKTEIKLYEFGVAYIYSFSETDVSLVTYFLVCMRNLKFFFFYFFVGHTGEGTVSVYFHSFFSHSAI